MSKKNKKNIEFNYMYRDGENYKRSGREVFTNPAEIPLRSIENLIRDYCSGNTFDAAHWQVPELFFPDTTTEDVSTHKFVGVEETTEEPTTTLSIGKWLAYVEAITRCTDDGCRSRAEVGTYKCALHSPYLRPSTPSDDKKPEKIGDVRI